MEESLVNSVRFYKILYKGFHFLHLILDSIIFKHSTCHRQWEKTSEKKHDASGHPDSNVMGEKWIWSHNLLHRAEERESDDAQCWTG